MIFGHYFHDPLASNNLAEGKVVTLTLSHYQYVFEILRLKDNLSMFANSIVIPSNLSSNGITAKLLIQASAYDFDIVKYLIEEVGLSP